MRRAAQLRRFEILEARPDIHLVFTDAEVPGMMDGIELAHYIRNRWPPVKLIVVSGEVAIDAKELPAGARFFPKPYRETSIVGRDDRHAVWRAIASRRQTKPYLTFLRRL